MILAKSYYQITTSMMVDEPEEDQEENILHELTKTEKKDRHSESNDLSGYEAAARVLRRRF